MNELIQQLLLQEVPLIDVRAPKEFAKGALPASVNLPIMDDETRHQVGITYKQGGQEDAMRKGFELVSGETRDAVISAWAGFVQANPSAHLYCARGGLRSHIACEWLADEGLPVPRIPGGYKAIRNFLLPLLAAPPPLMLVSGQTGCGKTRFLDNFQRKIDLEGLANHRGSAFGHHLTPQPPQAGFENALAVVFLQLGSQAPVLLEDEGKLVGRIHLPLSLQKAMAEAPILLIQASHEERTLSIYNEYIKDQWADYQATLGDGALAGFKQYLLTATDAIKKRLGGARHKEVRAKLDQALACQSSAGDLDGHKEWIAQLLTDYYDPMYDYQLSQKQERVIYAGSWQEAAQWWADTYAAS